LHVPPAVGIQARSQVSSFEGQNTFLGAQGFFCYVFKTNFSVHNKIWGEQKNLQGRCS